MRIVAHNNGITVPKVEDMIEAATMLKDKGNDKLAFQGIKILLDGSNQGFTGRLRPPGYLPHRSQLVCGTGRPRS